MKLRKMYLVSLVAACIVYTNVLYSIGIVTLYDERGPVDLGSIYNINNMVNL